MRPASLVFVTMSAFWLSGVDAQESTDGIPDELLCEQCPWDAPVRMQRDDFSSPNATVTVTADDMRSLGVVSVADMINQLPDGNGADSTEESRSDLEAPPNPGGSIEGPMRLQNESGEQAEPNRASSGTPTDDNVSVEARQGEQ